MASLQEPGICRLYKKTPAGAMIPILQENVGMTAPAGGAPDGASSSMASPEKLLTVDSNVELVNDDILLFTFEPAAGGDGIDVSDMIISIPLVTSQGNKSIQNSDFANPALADLTLIANEQVLGGYKIVESRARVAGKIFLDVQDDT
jgi:hypothetical protein